MNTSVDRRTPSITATDSRGLSTRQIAYLRTAADDTPTTLMSRQQHDVAGRLIAQWDARLLAPVIASVYGLASEPLKTESVDAGWRLNLPGLAGETLQRWDARGGHWRTVYDDQLRVVALEETSLPDTETFLYADASNSPTHNQRGQLLTQLDPSGTQHFDSYGLAGQPLRETRLFHDGRSFISQRVVSPLKAVLEQTDAGGHRQQSRYDLAGQLKHTQLQLHGQSAWQPVLVDAQYNAAGQIVEQWVGNGVVSRWRYDPADGRLHRQFAQVAQQPMLQDFEYVYDPVGNITRILDHVFTPFFFANQRIDGHREFSYDSLYRLHSASGYDDAPPSGTPVVPQPSDPNDRRNYRQTFTYDHGNNLIRRIHQRDGASHTLQMAIDPASNRGVRWAEGDPPPDFASLFDRNGNLLAVQPGQPMLWNARDQLASVTLVQRDNDPDDTEHYRYSQGVRVYKRHDFFNAANSHFHEVRYLPNLEIRSRDNGEELHVISVTAGTGTLRCLHWAAVPPSGIDQDQLRYTLEDHLGSSVMELDDLAHMISHEGYLPSGAPAWMSGRSQIEVAYKFVRYSGKEMDVSGLYYYGARYYAPWLSRWVSADPAGVADGFNLYGFTANNPLRFVDASGTSKAEWGVMAYSAFISELGTEAATLLEQLDNIINQTIGYEMMKNLTGESLNAVIGFAGGYGGSEVFGSLFPGVNSIPYVGGIVGGNAGGDLAADASSFAAPTPRLIRPLIPQTSSMSVAAIDSKLGLAPDQAMDYSISVEGFSDFFLNRIVGSVVPAVGAFLALGSRVQEAEDIKNRLTPVKIDKIRTLLNDWESTTKKRWSLAKAGFESLGSTVVYPANVLPNVNGMTPKEMLAPIFQAALQQRTNVILDYISRAKTGLDHYEAMGTTDNQFLLKQAKAHIKAARQ
ncbi:toxin [Pseudomonas syringae]|nr:toxin [Pseudomonas syringae]